MGVCQPLQHCTSHDLYRRRLNLFLIHYRLNVGFLPVASAIGPIHKTLFSGSHEAFFKSKCEHTIHEPSHGQDITFLKGELMKIEESLKVSCDKTVEYYFFLITVRSFLIETVIPYSRQPIFALFSDGQTRCHYIPYGF